MGGSTTARRPQVAASIAVAVLAVVLGPVVGVFAGGAVLAAVGIWFRDRRMAVAGVVLMVLVVTFVVTVGIGGDVQGGQRHGAPPP